MTCIDCGKPHVLLFTREVTVLERVFVEQVCSPCLREALATTRRLRESRGASEAR